MQINYLKVIQCDFLDFVFRFRHSHLKSTYDKNYRLLHALQVCKPAKSAAYQKLILPTVTESVGAWGYRLFSCAAVGAAVTT